MYFKCVEGLKLLDLHTRHKYELDWWRMWATTLTPVFLVGSLGGPGSSLWWIPTNIAFLCVAVWNGRWAINSLGPLLFLSSFLCFIILRVFVMCFTSNNLSLFVFIQWEFKAEAPLLLKLFRDSYDCLLWYVFVYFFHMFALLPELLILSWFIWVFFILFCSIYILLIVHDG